MLSQETFLGSSVRNFTSTIGWGGQPSTLEVGLVDDPHNGDSFNPPVVGHPVFFDYLGWTFGGLLQSSVTEYGEGGNPVYDVIVQDPRELLAGVQLILQDYGGVTYGIPNLYNIYGALEATYGFGGSQSNDSGIPWMLVRDMFANLQTASPIRFRGETFRFSPFVGLDVLPSYYRVGGGSISALDFVQDICNAIACDFFIGLINDPTFGYLITLYLVSRNSVPTLGKIDQFVTNVDGAVSKEQGFELFNAVVNKFVVGGKRADLYYQSNSTPDNPSIYANSILPYWGYDALNHLIVGNGDFVSLNGNGSEYSFVIDGRPIYLVTGIPSTIFYHTDLEEMRFARDSQDAWEAFIAFKKNVEGSIHKDKCDTFLLTEGANTDIFKEMDEIKARGEVGVIRAVSHSPGEKVKIDRGNFNAETIAMKVNKIYEYIRMYATEYYGKKFMVTVPFVLGKKPNLDVNDHTIILSHKPIDAGYIEEYDWGYYSANGTMPYNVEKLTTPDNRIECYVRFANIEGSGLEGLKSQYNLTHLNPDEYILDQYPNVKLGNMRENLFVKAKVEENYVFYEKFPQTSVDLLNPRAVITLSGPVAGVNENDLSMSKGLVGLIHDYLVDEPDPIDEALWDDVKKSLSNKWGSEIIWYGKDAMFYIPDLAVIPLESEILRYGPWHNYTTRSGRVDYEVENSLVPWEHGGFYFMDLVGNSMVQEALVDQDISEKGTITFPGVPGVQLGEALLNGGPLVTDISVNIAAEGVTTTYRMNTWSPRFGTIGKYNVDRLQKIARVAQDQRKAFRYLFGYKEPIRASNEQIKEFRKGRRHRGESSATMLAGDILFAGEGDELEVKTNVAAIAGYRMLSQMDEDSYVYKAGISLDGVFVPYTTNPANTDYLPKFITPSENAVLPTCITLNPFGEKGIALAFPDGAMPDNLCTEYDGYDGDVKGVGLKVPIIAGGWGYDIDGKPVPAAIGDPESFYPNYKNRADLWKVGPIDIRWDGSRGVWVTTSSASKGLVPGKVTVEITGRAGDDPPIAGSGQADLYKLGAGLEMNIFEESVSIFSDYTPEVPVGTWITIETDSDGNRWIVGADCP